MNKAPKWFLPVAIVALLWNLLGCMAYLSDVMLKPEDVARMTEAQQQMYASRTAWAVSATAVAVWAGALGCVGLILRKKWAVPALIASLLGVIVQDIGIFVLHARVILAEPVALVMQGVVLVVAIALVALARKANARGWTS